ncbi:MAG: hypothetical protein COB71_02870 [Thiotrichales bacterium]|nr:MAG: hypothetical protein COB71_02870 [Thiotrichales bacterium]
MLDRSAIEKIESLASTIISVEDTDTPVIAIDKDDKEVDTKLAINSIRKITVEAIKKGDHEHSNLSASKSSLEKIEAKGDNLPAAFIFKSKPYEDLSEREFKDTLKEKTIDGINAYIGNFTA